MDVWMETDGWVWILRGAKPTVHVTNFSFLCGRTYVKTKNREVEPTRRQAAVHTGMKALGFSESALPAGILRPPAGSAAAAHPNNHTGGTVVVVVVVVAVL